VACTSVDGGSGTTTTSTLTTTGTGGAATTSGSATGGAGGATTSSAGTGGAGGATTTTSSSGTGGAGGATTSSSGTGGAGGATTNGDTPIPDTGCATGVVPDPMVTSSTVGALTEDEFKALCDAQGGIFEIQPHCGGSNACRGFSYDANTETLIEHTCRATNTCAGYSCVVCG
jgi:hypothetical protein